MPVLEMIEQMYQMCLTPEMISYYENLFQMCLI